MLARAGRLVGGTLATLATLISLYHPGLVVLGGGVVHGGGHVLAAIRESVYRRSRWPPAHRDRPSLVGETAGLAGAVHLALDARLAPAAAGPGTADGVAGRIAGLGR
jgi:predicted NBD/HSP70 family sugar kinase